MVMTISAMAALQMSIPDSSEITKKLYETMKSEKGAALADVTLISSDNARIPALRVVLSVSSPYFDKLFSSEFAEKNRSEVSVSIASSLLREVLEFLYTDDCNLIRRIRNQAKDSRSVDCQQVQAVFDLADVGDYIDIERLVSRCKEAIQCMIHISAHFACLALRSLKRGRCSWGEELIKEAVEAALDDLDESLFLKEDNCDLKCGLMHLDDEAAQDAFTYFKEREAEEDTLFQALIVWASGGSALRRGWVQPSWTDADIVVDTDNIEILDERSETAKRIATLIDVSSLKPRFLANVVEPSKLVEQSSLYQAYKKHSTELEERVAITESKVRSNDRTLKKLKKEVKELRDML